MTDIKVKEHQTSSTPIDEQASSSERPSDTISLHKAIISLIGNIGDNSARISVLESKIKPETEYFKSATRVNKISILVFLLLPIVQLALTVILIQYYSPNNEIPSLVKSLVALIGVGAFIELFYVPYQIKKIDDRLDVLERNKT